MHLINTTPVPARWLVGPTMGGRSCALLVAKATFSMRGGRAPELCETGALPIYNHDVPTPLGLLPADVHPRQSDSFEVILLGYGYAPDGSATATTVALRLGEVRRELMVVGRRVWLGSGRASRPSAPERFDRVPLTWQEAHGGGAEVELGPGRSVELIDPLNRYGRGFDPSEHMVRLPKVERVEPGYPRTRYVRELPRVEDPAVAIEHWLDRPEPACWATIPPEIGFATIRTLRRLRSGAPAPSGRQEDNYDRAHPDWTIAVPEAGAEIEMVGLHAAGSVTTRLPRLRVVADFVIGRSGGTLDLAPRMLVLEPEAGRMSVVFRKIVQLDATVAGVGQECRVRLWLEEGFAEEVGV